MILQMISGGIAVAILRITLTLLLSQLWVWRIRPALVWLIRVVALPTLVIGVGLWLWWGPNNDPSRNSDLGAALVGGAVVAFVVLAIQQMLSDVTERRSLQITLSMQPSLKDIDLSKRNMTGFYLPRKDLTNANLRLTKLRGAELRDSILTNAKLERADLRDADLSGATLTHVTLQSAKYNSETKWPNDGFDLSAYEGQLRLDEGSSRWRHTAQILTNEILH